MGTEPLTNANLNEPVTAHLRQDFTRLFLGQTAGQALDWLRAHPPQGRVIYFYVVDDDGRLCGVVPTRRLILAGPDTPLADVMVRQVVALPAEATVLDACEFFILHRLLAFPVLDSERRVLGTVDLELYADELRDLSDAKDREELFQRVGLHMARGRQLSFWSAFRQRFPWLGCNLAAGIVAAFLTGVYEPELSRVVALAFFIPVVLNLAESVSSQSVSLALHALRGQPPTWSFLLRELGRELVTGLLLGAGAGALVALAALVWLGHAFLAVCLAGAITAGVAASAALGLAMPMLLRLLRLEPRVAAGPVALAGADIITILTYFSLARLLLG
jgi:magnesium transporter